MGNSSRRAGRSLAVACIGVMTLATACGGSAGSAGSDGDAVVLEFQQWWEPELPDGMLRGLVDQFEEENPGVTVELLSGPYASTKEQITAGAASGTMSDVVGLDGAWVDELVDQGAISDLSALMADAGYDDADLASQVQVDGATYMIPVANFAYMMFTNDDLLSQAGVDAPPQTREEFAAAAEAVASSDAGASGWVLPLSLEVPNGVQNDVMSWAWASGGSMLEDGQPDLTGPAVTSAVDFVQELSDDGVLAPGTANLKEQDKVEEFTNGRVAMMIDSLAHINLIRESDPDLAFSISAVPAEEGYTGERGITYASWGVGVSETSEHPEEAWRLVEFLLGEQANGELATAANAFPGNTRSVPDYVEGDPAYQQAFDVWNAGTPVNEFVGLPVAETLMRDFGEQLQRQLQGEQTTEATLEQAQQAWSEEF